MSHISQSSAATDNAEVGKRGKEGEERSEEDMGENVESESMNGVDIKIEVNWI